LVATPKIGLDADDARDDNDAFASSDGEHKRNPGQTPPRYKLITHVHQVLFMNQVKHLDDTREEADEIVEFDAEEAAIGAILKAIADYQTFTGERSQAMNVFLGWCYQNLDSEAIMEEFQQARKTDGV
jgi:hypothetical protein